MRFEEYVGLDGMAMAALIRQGDVTPMEVLDLARGRAEAINPALNALIHPLYDHAESQIGSGLSGPLAGVPMVVKDLFQQIRGAPHHMGSRALRAHGAIAESESVIVSRWKAAGLVPIGRTNTPEFGAKGITEPEVYGACRNPWQVERSPGGSSGGSAALVAAGVVPVAGANDGGGSIRIPASYCGLFGLKPGRGRTPWGPDITELMHGIAVNHVLTRSVRDSALILDLSHGWEPGSLFSIAPPEHSFLSSVGRSPGKLRIAFSTVSPLGTAVDPEAVAAVERAIALLESLGHEVEQAALPINGHQLCMDWLQIWCAQCAAMLHQIRSQTGCGLQEFEADTLAMMAFGRSIRADTYALTQGRWQQYMIALDRFLQDFDLVLTPTVAEPPPKIGQDRTPTIVRGLSRLVAASGTGALLRVSGLFEELAVKSMSAVPFTQLANVTGVPAMSVPLHVDSMGLPMGVQFVGTHGDEGKLLALAGQLEAAAPWFDRVVMGELNTEH